MIVSNISSWDLGCGVTVHGWFSKEDVNNGDVLPKGIVVDWDLARWKKGITKVSPDLSERSYQLLFSHKVRILQPHLPWSLVDVGSCQIPVSLQDAWLPHCHRGWGDVAERAPIQILRVTGAERDTQKFLSYKDLSLRSMIVVSAEISGAGGTTKCENGKMTK